MLKTPPPPAFVEPPPKPAAMLDILKKLQAKDKMGIFAEPVTEAIAPGYFAVITNPMDFRTLRVGSHPRVIRSFIRRSTYEAAACN